MSGCGAPQQGGAQIADTDQVVLAGKVRSGQEVLGGAFVRLLNASGEFTAEVVSAEDGDFRFYAAPGRWTVRALHRSGSGEAEVSAEAIGEQHQVDIAIT